MSQLQLDNSLMTVLIVDDTPENVNVLRVSLKPEGYKIAIAPDGYKAIEIAKLVNPDLILLDLMMPGIDGFETCRRMKADPQLKDIPVIFITAKNDPEDIVNGFKVGGVDYINKPFHRDEVCARVRTHAGLRYTTTCLEKLNRQKNEFMGICAHDLHTPLTAIIGYTSNLINDVETNTQIDDLASQLQTVNGLAHEMIVLINDILDVSVLERQHADLHLQVVALDEIIRKRVRINGHHAKKKTVKIEIECPVKIKARVDVRSFAQVVDNLFVNAISRVPDGSTISISLKSENDAINLQINSSAGQLHADTISANMLPDDSRGSLSAMELAFAKHVVEAHGGVLEIKSEPGKGLTYAVSIPEPHTELAPATAEP